MRSASAATRRGKRALGTLLLVLLLAPMGMADESPPKKSPEPAPLSPRLVQAHQAGDTALLRSAAEQLGSKAWEVIETLCDLPDGQPAAVALAAQSTDADTAAMRRYAAARKGRVHSHEALRALAEARAASRTRRHGAAGLLLQGVVLNKDTVAWIEVLGLRATAFVHGDRADEAMDVLIDGADRAEQLGWRTRAAELLGRAARLAIDERDPARARRAWERRYRLLRGRGENVPAATCLAQIATACAQQEDFVCARKLYQQAIGALVGVGRLDHAGITRANLGQLHLELGEYERALTHTEGGLALLREHGTKADVAETMGQLGNIRLDLGQADKALALHNAALALMTPEETPGAPPRTPSKEDQLVRAMVLGNCGLAYMELAEYEQAGRHLKAALDAFERHARHPYFVAVALGNLAELAYRSGDYVGADASLRGAMHHFSEIGAESDLATRLILQGKIMRARKHAKAAEEAFAGAQALGERLRDYGVVVQALTERADMCLEQGRTEDATQHAFRAVALLGGSLSHLADGEGAEARRDRLRTYQMPIRAALAADSASDCAEALDLARAGVFLETMGGRAALQETVVPKDLSDRLQKVRAAEALAWKNGDRAFRRRNRAKRKAARKRIDAARAKTQAVHEALQRGAKHAADVVYPRADELADIQATLAKGDVLVLYGLLPGASVAVVIDAKKAVIRRLPGEKAIRASCDALLLSEQLFVDRKKLPPLAAQIIAPLKLGKDVKRVLISPDGVLTYVPFALLLPDKALAMVPSGTAYRALLEEQPERGRDVVAFGNPAYGKQRDARRLSLYRGPLGATLPLLPNSGKEAEAVGTFTFTTTEATEANLRKAVKPTRKRPRLRALHLAGHGLANAENPQLSCIALCPSGTDDGFLIARDVMAMKIPADLVVLSACESVRGTIVRGEGLRGLTRAFMVAGASRVMASLWNVDDEATQVLMKKFYDLWNPKSGGGKPTAVALREAQEYMRTKTKWKAPEYWAAWVLWGIPD